MLRSRRVAVRWLEIVLVLVLLYSLLLVFAGGIANSLFTSFGFGPSESISTEEVTDYLRLPFMVLGSVMAGWSLLMVQLCQSRMVRHVSGQ